MTTTSANTVGPMNPRNRPKSKQGCRTCKSRKVKCDETQPECRRCTSTGRICEGYGIWGGGSRCRAVTDAFSTDNNPNSTSSNPSTSSSSSSPNPTSNTTPNTATTIILPRHQRPLPTTPTTLLNPTPPKPPIIPHPPPFVALPTPQFLTTSEQTTFDFFLHRSCIKLPGLNIPKFWRSTLLQASTTELPVLHAVLALGSLHRRDAGVDADGMVMRVGREGMGNDAGGGRGLTTTNTVEEFMLRQYACALRELRRVGVGVGTGTGNEDGLPPGRSMTSNNLTKDRKARRRTRSKKDLSVTLITAVVFVYFEFLREHYAAGITHLHFILRLLNELDHDDDEQQPLCIPPCGPNYTQTGNAALGDDWILEPILRLYVQANLFGGQLSVPLPTAFQRAAFATLPSLFSTLHGARWYLDLLIAEIVHLQFEQRRAREGICSQQGITTRISTKGAAGEEEEDEEEEDVDITHAATLIRSQLDIWQMSFAATMTAIADRATPRDNFRYVSSLNSMRMAMIMADILIQTSSWGYSPSSSSTTPSSHSTHTHHSSHYSSQGHSSEAYYDVHTPLFYLNLTTAISQWVTASNPVSKALIIGLAAERKETEPTIDQGWLYHLYFTAVKCRVHRIRQQALRLMRTNYHKEGIWDTGIVARICEEVVRLEEGDVFHALQGRAENGDRSNGEDCACQFGLTEEPPPLRGHDKDLVTLPTDRRLCDLRSCLPSSSNPGSDADPGGTPLAIEFTRRNVLGRVHWERREFVLAAEEVRKEHESKRWEGHWVLAAQWEVG